jgi:hypothetical protein
VPALAHLSVFDGVLVGLGPLQLREGAARG